MAYVTVNRSNHQLRRIRLKAFHAISFTVNIMGDWSRDNKYNIISYILLKMRLIEDVDSTARVSGQKLKTLG